MTDTTAPSRRWRLLAVVLGTIALATACSNPTSGAGSADAAEGTVSLSVLAFTSSAAGWNASVPAFSDTDAGEGVTVKTTYGPSSGVAQAVLDGTPADVVYLADQPNMDRLAQQEKVDPDWASGRYRGQPFGSIASLVVRKGNPLQIRSWADLLHPGVEVLAANPILSGSGKWGLMAGYASASSGGRDPQAGIDYLNKLILEHINVGPTTVQEALELFLAGRGDVLIAPENSALDAERHSPDVEQVVPPQTLRIDNQVAVVSTSAHRDKATSLVEYLYTPQAQRLWAEAGFRPAVPEVAREFATAFPKPQTLWTIDDLGGWDALDPKFYDPENGIITRIFDEATS
ncbi:extracellular solute-binding protein [Mycolicibacterium mengxianglii]|uniref:extracellular solute-binding protein n=1 Tax=Mycolicibacterium mengxianglii TaxID=2736649 RepID=UPI0018EEF45B|nr:extracellular solute-binding protein [Mycolicibacterium mengxianglii]